MATQLAHADQGGGQMTLNQAVNNLRGQLEQRAREFAMVLPAHITPEKLQRTIITAVQSDPDLLRADRQSLILACMKAAQDGLLPDKREAALVIFTENRNVDGSWVQRKLVQYLPMVYGLRKKILQSGEITDITAKVVYRREVEEGAFIYEEGTEAMLRHKPLLDLSEDEAADVNIVAAYSMATFQNGTRSYEVMRRFEIDKVRESSQTGATKDRRGNPRTPKGPWLDWYPEQAKKTAMRRHSKTLPMSGDVLDVEARDDAMYAQSTTTVLGSVDADAPTVSSTAPTRAQLVEGGGQGFDPQTGEVDEDAARALDSEGFAAMEGRSDEDMGERHNGTDPRDGDTGDTGGGGTVDDGPVHPGEAAADEFIERIARADVLGSIITVESDLKKAEGMREGDIERVKMAIANGKLRFGKPKGEGK